MTGLLDKPAPPWQDGSEIPNSCIAGFISNLVERVAPIPPRLAAELAARGLVGIEKSSASLQLLGDALSWIDRVPELASILHSVVCDIHLLATEPGYDISHSEPRWRRSIFVSIPDRTDTIGALRLAESIVHEAMHLQLTNRELRQRLIALEKGTTVSPWRAKARPYRGVLHGLYVFSCLAEFFRILLAKPALGEAGRRHAAQRLHEITDEVRSIDFRSLAKGLSEAGIGLMEQCRSVATERPASS